MGGRKKLRLRNEFNEFLVVSFEFLVVSFEFLVISFEF